MSGPGAPCVRSRRFLCWGAALFVSGPESVRAPRSLCRGPALSPSLCRARRSLYDALRALCVRGPTLFVSGPGALLVGARPPCFAARRSLCRGPALSVSGPSALCVGARRCLCRGSAALSVYGPGALCVGPPGPDALSLSLSLSLSLLLLQGYEEGRPPLGHGAHPHTHGLVSRDARCARFRREVFKLCAEGTSCSFPLSNSFEESKVTECQITQHLTKVTIHSFTTSHLPSVCL